MGSVQCTVQMFLFFLHNHKSYLLLSVCLIGRNLSRSCQSGVCSVLSVLFDYRCTRNPHVLGSNPRSSTRAPANKLMRENAGNRCSCESGFRSHASLTFAQQSLVLIGRPACPLGITCLLMYDLSQWFLFCLLL